MTPFSHWQASLQAAQMTFPHLHALACRQGCTVTVFDLETTGRDRQCGITEIGLLHVKQDGSAWIAGSRINPKRQISKEAALITGIKNADVAHLAHWGDTWARAMHAIATKHLTIGFNSSQFDCRNVIAQNARYGVHGTTFAQHVDVRELHVLLHKTRKGRLSDIAAGLGIDAAGAHAAVADVLMTAQILERWLEEHGLELIDRHPPKCVRSSPEAFTPATRQSRGNRAAITRPAGGNHAHAPAVARAVQEHGFRDCETTARQAGLATPAQASFALLGAMEMGLVQPDDLLDPATNRWLKANLPEAMARVWQGQSRGFLRPLLEDLQHQSEAPATLDYLQLHLALRDPALTSVAHASQSARQSLHR